MCEIRGRGHWALPLDLVNDSVGNLEVPQTRALVVREASAGSMQSYVLMG